MWFLNAFDILKRILLEIVVLIVQYHDILQNIVKYYQWVAGGVRQILGVREVRSLAEVGPASSLGRLWPCSLTQ